jgi:hypothetical protein
MSNSSNIGQTTVADLIDAIGANRVSPGAGAAGAVTLALAAACTAKAVAISLVHQPNSAVLRRSQATLDSIARFALAAADLDAETFSAFIKEHSPRTIEQVLRAGDRIGRLIDVLSGVIDTIESHIESNMAGDLVAARALADAAHKIQLTNATEIHEEKAALDSGV